MLAENVFRERGQRRDRELSRIKRTGARLLRQPLDWREIERSPGRYRFDELDGYVAAVAKRGFRLLPILERTPPFHSTAPKGTEHPEMYPPRPGAMGKFAAALARRYGPRGSFWSSRPNLPRVPVRAWQIWNEPNLPVYWPPKPDASGYARLLEEAATAIKKVDPRAEIVTAGLANSRLGEPVEQYTRKMFDAGAADAVDTFAVHPYARDVPEAIATVDQTRALLHDLGHERPIWVTEIGWASSGPRSPFTVDEKEQATLVRRALLELAGRREELELRGIVYYNWRDAIATFPKVHDFFGLHTGLLRPDESAKPALAAFTNAAHRIRD
jgi:hypothetical protein